MLDPGTSSQAAKLAMQTLDANGNVNQSAIYDFTNPSGNPLQQHLDRLHRLRPPFYRLSTSQVQCVLGLLGDAG